MNISDLLFESSRSFFIVSYSVGHGLLLLRSRKTAQNMTRLDILFQDVRALELRSWFEGLRIIEVGEEYLSGCQSNPVEMIEPGNKIYAIEGIQWKGYIIGGIFTVHEDDGDAMDVSSLLGPIHRQ